MRIVGLTGLPRSGKDSFAEHLCRFYGYKAFAFAGPLKVAAAELLDRPLSHAFGLDGFDREEIMPEWGFSMREFLQKLGTECMRVQIRQDFWIKRMEISLKKLPPKAKVVITDVRFENETKMIRDLGGMMIQINRPGLVKSDHPSDAGVKILETETIVENCGTLEQLHEVVDALFSPDG